MRRKNASLRTASGDWRRPAVGAACLGIAVLAAALEGLPLLHLSVGKEAWAPWRDLRIVGSMLPLEPGQRDYVGPGYARDRDYALFLRYVERSAGDADRIFLRVDDMEDWYRYRAAYRLAPVPVELFDPATVEIPSERQVLLAWRTPVPPGWERFAGSREGSLARRVPVAAEGDGP